MQAPGQVHSSVAGDLLLHVVIVNGDKSSEQIKSGGGGDDGGDKWTTISDRFCFIIAERNRTIRYLMRIDYCDYNIFYISIDTYTFKDNNMEVMVDGLQVWYQRDLKSRVRISDYYAERYVVYRKEGYVQNVEQ